MKARIWAVALLVAGLVAPPGPSAAAEPEPRRVTTLIAGPATFERGGETYRLTIRATDYPQDSDDSIDMTIRRTRDPDGDGPARSRQTHTRMFAALDMVSSDRGLDHASVVTDDKLAPHGEISVEFAPTGPAERAPCYGAKRTVRKGRINGTVRFASGTSFGDVVFTSMRARLDSVEGTVCLHGDPPPPCQRPGWWLWAQDGDVRMSAFKGRRRLIVAAARESNLAGRDSATDGYVMERSVTRLPLDHARLGADLGSATVRGLRGTDVRRKAIFSATSGARGHVSECYDHTREETRETVERRRRGTVGGTMRFAFFIGPDERLVDRPLVGSLTRFRNRPSD